MTSSGAFQRVTGSALRAYREGRGQSLRGTAKRAGISVGHIAEIERGEKHVGSEIFAAICRALDVPQAIIIADAADRMRAEEIKESEVAA